MTININKMVQVVLTQAGVDLLDKSDVKTYWRRSWIKSGSTLIRIECQLWNLMAVFGPHSYPGAPPYFVNNDVILTGRVEQ